MLNPTLPVAQAVECVAAVADEPDKGGLDSRVVSTVPTWRVGERSKKVISGVISAIIGILIRVMVLIPL